MIDLAAERPHAFSASCLSYLPLPRYSSRSFLVR